jgi:hypothetical protein
VIAYRNSPVPVGIHIIAHALGFFTAALAPLATPNYSLQTPNVTAEALNTQKHTAGWETNLEH